MKKSCVRQVLLEKWFPLIPCAARSAEHTLPVLLRSGEEHGEAKEMRNRQAEGVHLEGRIEHAEINVPRKRLGLGEKS